MIDARNKEPPGFTSYDGAQFPAHSEGRGSGVGKKGDG